jgi:hypothetical protein
VVKCCGVLEEHNASTFTVTTGLNGCKARQRKQISQDGLREFEESEL